MSAPVPNLTDAHMLVHAILPPLPVRRRRRRGALGVRPAVVARALVADWERAGLARLLATGPPAVVLRRRRRSPRRAQGRAARRQCQRTVCSLWDVASVESAGRAGTA